MTARVTVTKTLQCAPSELTVEILQAFLENESPESKVNLRVDSGDRPGERGQLTVTIGGVL